MGPAALADGVHYFILSPERRHRAHGQHEPGAGELDHRTTARRLADFPSPVYQTVQLWYVPASPYDPVADVVDIAGGVYVNTVGSHCGGYTVTNGRSWVRSTRDIRRSAARAWSAIR